MSVAAVFPGVRSKSIQCDPLTIQPTELAEANVRRPVGATALIASVVPRVCRPAKELVSSVVTIFPEESTDSANTELDADGVAGVDEPPDHAPTIAAVEKDAERCGSKAPAAAEASAET